MENDSFRIVVASLCLLCCCCTVFLAAIGGGLWYFVRRNRNKSAESAVSVATPAPSFSAPPAYTPPSPPVTPSPAYESLLVKDTPPEPPPLSPASAADVRAALLALNSPDKLYAVRAEGDRLFCVLVGEGLDPGYTLEIVLDEANHVAGFMEAGTGGESTARADARQVLEAARWTVQD